MRTEKTGTVDPHVLVAGEKDIKSKLFTDAPALVFVTFRQNGPSCHITLKSAVVDAHRDIRSLRSQFFQRRRCGGKSVTHDHTLQILRRLPFLHVMAGNARKPDAKPVFQRGDGSFPHAPDPIQIGAEADGVKL